MYGVASKISIAAQSVVSLAGKKMIVVGGTGGIGLAIAKASMKAGASVTIVGRTNRGTEGLNFVPCDVSLMSNVRKLASDLPIEGADYLCFTNGIVPAKVKVVTAEGIEEDMATSALSRFVFLNSAESRLKAGARVFIWGFPGSGVVKEADVADINSEKRYGGGFSPPTHANTVALNEALVAHWASKGVVTAGFNPGLIKTAIRNSMHGGKGFVAGFMEGVVSLFNPDTDQYAQVILPLFTAPELAEQKGLHFGQKGTTIKPSPELTPAAVQRWIDAANALAEKAGASDAAKVTA